MLKRAEPQPTTKRRATQFSNHALAMGIVSNFETTGTIRGYAAVLRCVP